MNNFDQIKKKLSQSTTLPSNTFGGDPTQQWIMGSAKQHAHHHHKHDDDCDDDNTNPSGGCGCC